MLLYLRPMCELESHPLRVGLLSNMIAVHVGSRASADRTSANRPSWPSIMFTD
jgi:hypothetical protein